MQRFQHIRSIELRSFCNSLAMSINATHYRSYVTEFTVIITIAVYTPLVLSVKYHIHTTQVMRMVKVVVMATYYCNLIISRHGTIKRPYHNTFICL